MRGLLEWLRLLNAPCRDITALLSKSLDTRLPLRERFAARLHVLYCKACKRFKKQTIFLRQAMRAATDSAALAEKYRLTAAARARIARALDEHA
jgi:hypothetical protein